MLARLSTTLIYVLLVSVTIAAASPTLAVSIKFLNLIMLTSWYNLYRSVPAWNQTPTLPAVTAVLSLTYEPDRARAIGTGCRAFLLHTITLCVEI
jgi:hypothetical protein